jgi:arsenite transporter
VLISYKAIAVGVASFGADGPEVLAATSVVIYVPYFNYLLTAVPGRLGPLVEVPVLLLLSYVALWLKDRMKWSTKDEEIKDEKIKS